MKSKFLIIFILLFTTCQDIFKEEELEYKALKLALEQNLELITCDYYGSSFFENNIYLIPLNKEIIDATIDYKVKVEKLDEQEKILLIKNTNNIYLDGQDAVFVLLVYVNSPNNANSTKFIDFKNNVYLKNELGTKFNLKKFTHNFESELIIGWNKGYLYFDNFRKNRNNYSYSVHFDKFRLFYDEPKDFNWAFSFDDSEIQFLSILQKGTSESDIRHNFNIEPLNLSASEIANIIGTIVNILTLLH